MRSPCRYGDNADDLYEYLHGQPGDEDDVDPSVDHLLDEIDAMHTAGEQPSRRLPEDGIDEDEEPLTDAERWQSLRDPEDDVYREPPGGWDRYEDCPTTEAA